MNGGRQYGLSLIEIIVTLVIFAMAGTLVMQYMGTAYTRSSAPISRIADTDRLRQVIEHITADYNQSTKDAAALTGLEAAIGAGTYTGPGQAVVTNVIEDFDPANPNDTQVLRVTVRSVATGARMTVLFSAETQG